MFLSQYIICAQTLFYLTKHVNRIRTEIWIFHRKRNVTCASDKWNKRN